MIKKILLTFSIILVSACGTSHRNKAIRINTHMDAGDYASIIKETTGSKIASKAEVQDIELLDALNAGSAMFFNQNYETSTLVLEQSDMLLNEYFSKSLATKASKEVISNINNASILDYQPMVLDNIYLSSYKILNCLALEDKECARVEVNKSYSKQQNAAEYFSKEIDKSNAEADKEVKNMDPSNKKLWDEKKDTTIDQHFGDLSKWRGYKNYMNPYTTYLGGLYFMTNAQNRNDFETASTYMKRAAGMTPQNSFLKKDLKQAEKASNFNSFGKDKYVWIIYENGLVADFDEIRIDVPAFILTSSLSTVTFAMPKPRVRAEAFPYIYASIDDKEKVKTEVLADVDSMFIAEFNKRLPAIITRAVTSTITKTAMQYAAIEAAKQQDNGWAAAAIIASTTAYSLSTSSADLRSWHTLPKNVQIAKLKLNKSEKLLISIDNDINIGEVNIPMDGNSIVYIRIPSIMSKPVISVIKI